MVPRRYDISMHVNRRAAMTPPRRLARSKPRPPTGRPARPQPTRLRVFSILAWADAFYRREQRWPKQNSGEIPECPWTTWRQVSRALQSGFRGLRGGASLARLLAQRRGVRNQGGLPRLSVRQILAWADQHHARTGTWPNERSGRIGAAPHEKWGNISAALRDGGRGRPGGSSLARLLAKQRGVRNRGQLPGLSVRQVLRWADAHQARTGRWPTALAGVIAGTNGETWRGVQNSLVRGARGLPGGTTLADLLAKDRGYRNVANLPPLSVRQIRQWARAYFAEHGRWPTHSSGPVPGTSETWVRINAALRQGFRGFRGGSSLLRVLKGDRARLRTGARRQR